MTFVSGKMLSHAPSIDEARKRCLVDHVQGAIVAHATGDPNFAAGPKGPGITLQVRAHVGLDSMSRLVAQVRTTDPSFSKNLDNGHKKRHANAMTLIGLLCLLAVAGLCGSLGSALAGYSHTGCLASIVLGFLGAWIGTWVARETHLPMFYVLHVSGEAFPVVWSVVGAAMFGGATSILTARSPQGF
jgi:uncharacterized membrane protein YeaQ/YmgE (transglycosylase-associated protein family)